MDDNELHLLRWFQGPHIVHANSHVMVYWDI